MDKATAIALVRAGLQAQFDRIAGAAQAAKGYATDADSKAESKYDTRSLEASYLAIGQGAHAEELAGALEAFDAFEWPDLEPGEPVQSGALVELDFDGERSFYLLAPAGGGISCRSGDTELTVLTPMAPLFRDIAGLRSGQAIPGRVTRVISVC